MASPYRTPQTIVKEFYRAFGEPIHEGAPSFSKEVLSDERLELKLALIIEEVSELVDAAYGEDAGDMIRQGWIEAKAVREDVRDTVEMFDALLDIEVVTNGLANEGGMPMDDGLIEVQRSNMTKLDENGKPLRSDGTDGKPVGKIIKSHLFEEPDLPGVLRDAGWRGE